MKIQAFLYIAALSVLTSCSSGTKKQEAERAVSVKTYYPVRTNSDEISISGIVSAKQTAVISTKIMGYIDKIYVKQGDVVRQGQPLMMINSSELNAKNVQAAAMITEAAAAAKDAQKDYQRYLALHEQKSVSDKELENIALRNTSANAHLQMARQGLKEVKSMLAYAYIRAPFSGVVTQKMVDEGTIANPGMPLLSVEQSGDMNITASVPENYVTQVRLGDKVSVDIKSIDTTIDGVVSELSPSATMTGGQYAMKVSVNLNSRAKLRAGMYAGIRIPNKTVTDGSSQILARKSSILTKDQLTGVYVAGKDNRAILHWVRLGNEIGDQVVVMSGLTETDRVIENANVKLFNGQKIVITD